MLTQRDIDELEKIFVTEFFLKQELQKLKSDLVDKLDKILKEINEPAPPGSKAAYRLTWD